MEGKFVRSFLDDFALPDFRAEKRNYEHIKKDLAISLHDNVYISDANTGGVRGVNNSINKQSALILKR